MSDSKVHLRRLVTLGVSLALIGAALLLVGPKDAIASLREFPVTIIAIVMALFAANLWLVSYRLYLALKHFNLDVPFRRAWQASLAGQLAGQVFISLFGQVVGRHMVLRRNGISPVLIASVTGYERLIQLIVSALVCILGSAFFMDGVLATNFAIKASLPEITLSVLIAFVVGMCVWRSRFESSLLTRISSSESLQRSSDIALISLSAQALVLSAFVVGARFYLPEATFVQLCSAAAIVSFAASLPITVNGWGLREIAAIYVFGQLGMSAADAMALSLLVGISSTVVVFLLGPTAMKRFRGSSDDNELLAATVQRTDRGAIEKTAAWLLGTAACVLIFFQLYVKLPGGVINLNLADPFALLAIAAMVVHVAHTRRLPEWDIPVFNRILIGISLFIVLGFIHGVAEIGVTQWALMGRLIGWLVLLGYLSLGWMMLAYAGRHGMRRIAVSMSATAAVIVLLQIVLRWLNQNGLVYISTLPPGFDGYASNRNAFAFQLIVCSALMLSYSRLYAGRRMVNACTVLHAFILAGIVFTASRAGLIVEGMLLLLALGLRLADRRQSLAAVAMATLIWTVPQIPVPAIFADSQGARVQVQGAFSYDSSNVERIQSLKQGLSLWQESPVFGVGLGVAIEKSTEGGTKAPLVIHCTPLWIMTEFGLLGVAGMTLVLVAFIGYLRKSKLKQLRQRSLALLLVAFCVFGLVHEIFYQRVFWLVLGGLLASCNILVRSHSRAPINEPGIDHLPRARALS